MLDSKTIEIIKKTVPDLIEKGEELTTRFYKRMFKENPEVLPYFNRTHQVQGTQQKALAGAICSYAMHIDNPEVLKDALLRIAHKHASLHITSDQYPVVGKNLLAAIKELLGEAATDEIVDAWEKAYVYLADVLIKIEEDLYSQSSRTASGWRGFKRFLVSKVVDESDDVRSLYLIPESGGAVPFYRPGQYISVRVRDPEHGTTMRNYSLSDMPNGKYLRISVKRERVDEKDTPDGYVSTYLHTMISIGSVLEVAPPFGTFVLSEIYDTKMPLIFIAGGIGITPLLSMAKYALKSMAGRDVLLLHCCKTPEVQPFLQELSSLGSLNPRFEMLCFYEAIPDQSKLGDTSFVKGLFSPNYIRERFSSFDAEYYVCGPLSFMDFCIESLLERGVNRESIHYELFGPHQELSSLNI